MTFYMGLLMLLNVPSLSFIFLFIYDVLSLTLVRFIYHAPAPSSMKGFDVQVVYILDQVRALEKEMLLRIQKQGLDFTPRILIVSISSRVRLFLFEWIII